MCSTCGCAEGNLYIEGMNTAPTPRFAPRPFPLPASRGGTDRHHLRAAAFRRG